jgi:hypothetical protein
VPLDPALAIANRFQVLAEQKTTQGWPDPVRNG